MPQATAMRAAAGVSTCPKVGDNSQSLTINNSLDRTLTMRGRDIDCDYWFAPSTPDVVLDNVRLGPGQGRSFTLTHRSRVINDQRFTMDWAFLSGSTAPGLGSSRMRVLPGVEPTITSHQKSVRFTLEPGVRSCQGMQRLSPTGADSITLDGKPQLAGGISVIPYQDDIWATFLGDDR